MSTALPEHAGVVAHRPRLSRLLDAAVERPITLLSAPAGWGKTSAVQSWLAHRPGPHQWFGLDPSGVAATVDGFDRLAEPMAGASTERPGLVVVDDVHLGDPAGVHRLLPLAGDRLRLVLLTRDDAALPVPRWRLSGAVTEIGCAELAFTTDETVSLLAGHDLAWPSAEAEHVHHRTEGWPAGIRFAALRGHADDPVARQRYDVDRYLRDEVLDPLPAGVRDLLLCTGLLDQVRGDLADVLLGSMTGTTVDDGAHRDADTVLGGLSMVGGFVLPLGGDPAWYRYHHQLRDVLRSELRRIRGGEFVTELHGRAAAWLAHHDLPTAALRHRWAGGDRAGAASLGPAGWAAVARSGCHPVPAEPPILSDVDGPSEALAYVVDRLQHADLPAVDSGLRALAEHGSAGDAEESDNVRYGHSTVEFRSLALARERLAGDLTATAVCASSLLDAGGPQDVRPAGLAALSAAHLGAGDLDATADVLAEAEDLLSTAGRPGRPAASACAQRAIAGTRALLAAILGDLTAAERSARAALAVPPCAGQPPDIHAEPAYLALALAAYERDRLAEVNRLLDSAGRARRLSAEPEVAAWARLAAARLRGALGDVPGAVHDLGPAGGAVPPRLLAWFAAAEADLLLGAGDTRSARTVLAPLLDPDPVLAPTGTNPPGLAALAVQHARTLLADGDTHGAARTLPPWADDDKADATLPVRLDAGLTEARVADCLGDARRRAEHVERVLELAAPHGIRRPLADPASRDLLAAHLDTGTAHWSTVHCLVDRAPAPPATHVTAVAEALTERELTVLRYLQSMLSNEEIAAKLFVSVNTVKTHVRHVYRKLEVSHRRGAVRRARDLRLL